MIWKEFPNLDYVYWPKLDGQTKGILENQQKISQTVIRRPKFRSFSCKMFYNVCNKIPS